MPIVTATSKLPERLTSPSETWIAGVQLRCSGCVIADVWMCNWRTVVSVANRTARLKAANKVSRRNRGLMLRSVFQISTHPQDGRSALTFNRSVSPHRARDHKGPRLALRPALPLGHLY